MGEKSRRGNEERKEQDEKNETKIMEQKNHNEI